MSQPVQQAGMPSQSSHAFSFLGPTFFHQTTPLTFPDVPPSVSSLTSVADQIDEMKEYFIAWRSQNATHRNYVPYFKAAMSVLEGGWLLDGALHDDTPSDRHEYDGTDSILSQKFLIY
jgi:hypothetical protein